MSEIKIHPVPAEVASHAHIDNETYQEMYRRSVEDPEGFWAEQAEEFVTWFKPWDTVMDVDYHKAHIRWFEGRQAQRLLQLRRPPPGEARRPDRDHLGKR